MITDIRELQKSIHEWAKGKGWWEEERNMGEMIALMHSELSEALEEWRSGRDKLHWSETGNAEFNKPEGLGTELADCIIRILDTMEACGYDAAYLIHMKMKYNETRPYRHGGKKA